MTPDEPGSDPGSSRSRASETTARSASRRRRTWASAGLVIVAVLVTALAVATVVRLSNRPSGPAPWPPSPRAGVDVIDVESAALGHTMPVLVWVPEGTQPDARLPLVVLFHGQGGDASAWFHGIGADQLAGQLIAEGRIPHVILASAGIGNSMGIDSAPADDGYDHGAYGTYLADELVPWLVGRYPISGDPDDRFVAGFSMGGYAALHLAFRHPERFGGVGGLSPAVALDIQPERAWLYGDEAQRDAHDPQRLAERAPLGDLRTFLGYGATDYDWITHGTRVLAARLTGRDVPVLLADPPPGGHEGATWRALTTPMLEWLLATKT